MDVLSDVLGAVHLTGAVFLEMEPREDWSYLTAPARAIADVLMPAADHVIPFHLVAAGTCFARLEDGEPVQLTAGEVVLFPAGDRHVLVTASDAGLRLKPVEISGESLRDLLRRGTGAILHIATDVGYESEAAFSRAFKREFGLPPAAWRRRLASRE